jgi:cytochrome c553
MANRAGALILAAALASVAMTASAPAAERAPDTMAARVAACAPCHGDQGQGTSDPYFPRLAGKPSGYLYNQLVAFRDGRRKYPPMNYLLEYLSEPYLKAIAEHFAAQHPPFAPPEPTVAGNEELARGRALATQGDAALGVPACASCHGQSLTGMEPAVPGLLGLRPAYISAQLGAWRYGTRTAFAPDCMQLVAAHLTENDVKAVAAWLASQHAPQDARPIPKSATPLPFSCGSEPN